MTNFMSGFEVYINTEINLCLIYKSRNFFLHPFLKNKKIEIFKKFNKIFFEENITYFENLIPEVI